ncbi:MAG: ROK family protein [Jatrophihabitans sp.]|nr:MAG: ROK family protein [Jatrophihabitans sp.]
MGEPGEPAVIGVDIGGTKIAAGRVTASGAVAARAVRATPRTGGAQAVLAAVVEMVGELGPAEAVGVGAPGVVDVAGGRVLSATEVLPGWAGAEVGTALRAALGVPVAVDNDVRVMALGELCAGAGRGARDLLFVSVGTGVGGALALDGRIRHGSAWSAGELGHLLVPHEGAVPCGCGRRDHLEAAASGPAIVAEYRRRGGEPVDGLPEVAARMRAGDAVAAEVIAAAATLVGRAVAGLVDAIGVQRVVVGGGVASIGAAYVQHVADAFRAEVLPPLRDVPVVAAELGTDAPLVGAAELARRREGDR